MFLVVGWRLGFLSVFVLMTVRYNTTKVDRWEVKETRGETRIEYTGTQIIDRVDSLRHEKYDARLSILKLRCCSHFATFFLLRHSSVVHYCFFLTCVCVCAVTVVR